jgi:hypothetical protein
MIQGDILVVPGLPLSDGDVSADGSKQTLNV